jgi:hypothetical protein
MSGTRLRSPIVLLTLDLHLILDGHAQFGHDHTHLVCWRR